MVDVRSLENTTIQFVEDTINVLSDFIFSDSQITLSRFRSSPKKTILGYSNKLRGMPQIVQALQQDEVSVRLAYANAEENPTNAGMQKYLDNNCKIISGGPIQLFYALQSTNGPFASMRMNQKNYRRYL